MMLNGFKEAAGKAHERREKNCIVEDFVRKIVRWNIALIFFKVLVNFLEKFRFQCVKLLIVIFK